MIDRPEPTPSEPAPSEGEGRTLSVSWSWAEHLGTGLTVGYLALIVIGIFHTAVLLSRFGINVLDFAEAGDFLLAPLRDPLVIVATLVPIGVVYLYLRGSERWTERARAERAAAGLPRRWWHGDPERFRRYRLPLWIATILLWVLASGLHYEAWAADRLKLGHGPRVRVELSSGQVEAGTPGRPVMLIGSSGGYLFLFRTGEWRSVIVPVENVVRIVPEEEASGRRRLEPRLPPK